MEWWQNSLHCCSTANCKPSGQEPHLCTQEGFLTTVHPLDIPSYGHPPGCSRAGRSGAQRHLLLWMKTSCHHWQAVPGLHSPRQLQKEYQGQADLESVAWLLKVVREDM